MAAVVLSVLAVGCAPETVLEPANGTQAATPGTPQLAGGIVPMCQQGCVDTDPNPEAPGVFLGSGVTDEICFGTAQTDNDGDGLSTFCEKNLAAAFAPELRYSSVDEMGREPYWAARPGGLSGTGIVTIIYMIGYYRDAGSSAYICTLPFAHSSCFGHNGDSETIILDVYYDSETQHWILNETWYSVHEMYGIHGSGSNPYPMQLDYPSHPGAYPRSWISEGKHANYQSESACNAGGTLNIDTCTHVDTSARLLVSAAYNVGSNAVRLIDCVSSRNTQYIYYGSGRQECFWTTANFRGWIPTSVGGAESSPYRARLTTGGF